MIIFIFKFNVGQRGSVILTEKVEDIMEEETALEEDFPVEANQEILKDHLHHPIDIN